MQSDWLILVTGPLKSLIYEIPTFVTVLGLYTFCQQNFKHNRASGAEIYDWGIIRAE